MEEPAASLECIDALGSGLRVDFFKQGDRYSHTILGLSGVDSAPLLQSMEGTADDFSPPSPPFAELHQQGEIIFLSGATTIGHWSGSVSICEQRLHFDIACRLKKETYTLGSEYQVFPAQNRSSFVMKSYPEEDESAGDIVHFGNDNKVLTRIACLKRSPFEVPSTVQWRYRISHALQ